MKRLLLSALSILTLYNALAQAPGIYLKVGAGYAFALAGQTLDNNGIPINGNIAYVPANPNLVNTFDVKKASFSSGLQTLVAVGYMCNENIGLEIDANAVPIAAKYDVYEYNTFNPAQSDVFNNHLTRQINFPFFITPSLVYSTGNTNSEGGLKKISAYAHGGIVLPLITKMVEEQQFNNPITGEDEYIRQETKMNFGVGFSGAMGIKFNASPNFGLWAEFNMMAMSLYPSQTTITDHTLDGDPSTRTPVAGTVIKYASNGTFSPTLQPLYSIPFSNFGFNMGIMLFFNPPKPSQSIRK